MRLRAVHRLFLSYLLLICLVVLALSLGADSMLRRQLVWMAERDLRRELRLHAMLYETLPSGSPDSVADLLGQLTRHRITIVDPTGVVRGESTRDGAGLARMENHLSRPEIQEALRGRDGASVRHSATLGTDQLYVAVRTRRGDVVRASVPLSEIDAAVQRVQRGVLTVGAAAMALAALFSLGFSLAFTRPLRRLQTAATAMAAGDLDIRLREERGEELGELAHVLDTLAGELQRRLAQLEGERAEMQALFDSMAEGVLALDPDGSVRGANPAAERMFALRGPSRGLPPESVSRRPEFLRVVRRALKGETVSATELSGDDRALLATAQPLPQGGAVVVLLDVSELRRLESVRRDFVANASHELKTPLTAIRGYSETLLDPELPPELARRFVEVVHDNAERLQHIVDDLLDLTRIESGGWVAQPECVELARVAEDAWNAQAIPGREGEVHFHIAVDPACECVHADPAALAQVFTNLFSNALRYTPPGGSISVVAAPAAPPRGRATRLRSAADGATQWVEVEVRDTGSGIPAAHLPRIFERFYRVDPARSRAMGGTGLGLAIVKHLVEAHGGQVGVESRVGEGTTIRFSLPAATG